MNWREEQEQFWRWITQPEFPEDQREAIDGIFAPHTGLSRSQALNIYNNAYHQRMISISSQLYPMVYRTLGEQAYAALWLAYMQAHPPRPGSVNQLGRELHDFASQHPHYGKLPALLDIIALETAFIDCFDRADEPAYSLAQLRQVPAGQWPLLSWRAKHDWVLIDSDFDLEDYYRRLGEWFADESAQPGSAPFGVAPLDKAATYLVRRQDQRMHFQKITPAMAQMLRGIVRGECFATLCELLAEQWPDRDIPQMSLALLMQAIDWELLHSGD